ncbi:MAG: O-antigen ligase family protein [Ferruginibacter sp.]
MSKKKTQPALGKTLNPATARKISQPVINKDAYWLIILLSILPFIFSRTILDPVIVPRFLLLAAFITGFSVWSYFISKSLPEVSYNKLFIYIFVVGIAFNVWSVICTLPSLNPSAGYFEMVRQWVNLAFLFLVFHIFYNNEPAIIRVSKVFVFISGIHALIGLLQYYGLVFNNLPGSNALPYGLMGNRNLFGSAQVFTLPFLALVWLRCTGAWKNAAAVSGILLAISIVLSQTRSAWLSTLGFFIIVALLLLIFLKPWGKKWLLATGVFLGAGLIAAVLFVSTDKEGTLSSEIRQRSASLTGNSKDSTIASYSINDRITIWKKTLILVKEHPATGVGIGNWKIRINENGTKGLSWAAGYFVPDRVHNVYLHIASETGIPGLLLFCLFGLGIILAAFFTLRKPGIAEDKLIVILMLGGFGSFAVDAMFSFPLERIEHSVYLALMAGIILSIYVRIQPAGAHCLKLPVYIRLALVVIGILGFAIGLSRKKFEENLYMVKGLEQSGNMNDMISYAEAGKTRWVTLDQEGLSLEAKEAIGYRTLKNYPQAIATMKQALVYNPNSPLANNNMGTIYTEMQDFKSAIPYYEKALLLAPDFNLVKKNLAVNYFNLGLYKKTADILQEFDYTTEPMFVDMLAQSREKLKDSTSVDTLNLKK